MSTHRTNIPNSLNEHWMPFSANRDFKKNPRLITSAKGVYLNTHEGNTLIDASSGLFCNPLGHGREEIAEAVGKQLRELDFVLPFKAPLREGHSSFLKVLLQKGFRAVLHDPKFQT